MSRLTFNAQHLNKHSYKKGCSACFRLKVDSVNEIDKKDSKRVVQPTIARKKPPPLPLNDVMMLKAKTFSINAHPSPFVD